jgi:hypothetical protein
MYSNKWRDILPKHFWKGWWEDTGLLGELKTGSSFPFAAGSVNRVMSSRLNGTWLCTGRPASYLAAAHLDFHVHARKHDWKSFYNKYIIYYDLLLHINMFLTNCVVCPSCFFLVVPLLFLRSSSRTYGTCCFRDIQANPIGLLRSCRDFSIDIYYFPFIFAQIQFFIYDTRKS